MNVVFQAISAVNFARLRAVLNFEILNRRPPGRRFPFSLLPDEGVAFWSLPLYFTHPRGIFFIVLGLFLGFCGIISFVLGYVK